MKKKVTALAMCALIALSLCLSASARAQTVAGNFYTLLKNITAVANNCHLPMAMGMTAFGSPSVLVEGLSIAGK